MSQNNRVQPVQNGGVGGVVSIVTNGVTHVARTYPKLTAAYVIGLSVIMFATGFAVDSFTKNQFNVQMAEVNRMEAKHLDPAFDRQQIAYDRYYYSKGWFSCDHTCNNNYNSYLNARDKYTEIEMERDALESKARQTVGIFSEYAVADSRRIFWEYWDHGWRVAKDMSWWDALFGIMFSGSRRRDEDGMGLVLQLLGRVMWNFTVGLFMSVCGFIINLISWVQSYNAGFMGLLFFTLASCAAMSVFISFMLAMCGVVGGGAYVVATNSGAAIRNGGNNGRYGRRNNYRRPVQNNHGHYQ